MEAIKERVKAMEAEAEKLKELQSEVESQMSMGEGKKYSISFISWIFIQAGSAPMGSANFPTLEEKVDADNRSIYIGQVGFLLWKSWRPILNIS